MHQSLIAQPRACARHPYAAAEWLDIVELSIFCTDNRKNRVFLAWAEFGDTYCAHEPIRGHSALSYAVIC